MNALDLRRASLVGHSLGGGIALGFTLTRPDRVEKLIVVDSNGLTEDVALVGKLLIPFFTLKAKLKHDETYLSMLRNKKGNTLSFLDRLPEITTPTLIVWGEWDGYMPVKLAYRAHMLIKNSRLHVFKRCWHAPQRSNAKEFNRLVLDFLKQ
jgi:pimeloyl-ACP methyl ester carboxylesterase